jgi:hypothetical protein
MRNPASVLETLRNQQRAFDGRALDRFLARHIGDARRFKQQVLDQQYEALKNPRGPITCRAAGAWHV